MRRLSIGSEAPKPYFASTGSASSPGAASGACRERNRVVGDVDAVDADGGPAAVISNVGVHALGDVLL
jgi:hypothetical protein